jgi:hypothetical protein
MGMWITDWIIATATMDRCRLAATVQRSIVRHFEATPCTIRVDGKLRTAGIKSEASAKNRFLAA